MVNWKEILKQISGTGTFDCSAIDVKPREFNFDRGYPEEWDYIEAAQCSECGEPIISHGEDHHCDVDRNSECNGYVNNEGPMMNYFWPLPNFEKKDHEEIAKRLANVPMCLIHLEDQDLSEDESWGLALTGGGTDLSWEIAEAYILCGFYPPAHLSSLPQMSGKSATLKNLAIMRGLEESFIKRRNWSNSSITGIKELRKQLREVTKAKKENKTRTNSGK